MPALCCYPQNPVVTNRRVVLHPLGLPGLHLHRVKVGLELMTIGPPEVRGVNLCYFDHRAFIIKDIYKIINKVSILD